MAPSKWTCADASSSPSELSVAWSFSCLTTSNCDRSLDSRSLAWQHRSTWSLIDSKLDFTTSSIHWTCEIHWEGIGEPVKLHTTCIVLHNAIFETIHGSVKYRDYVTLPRLLDHLLYSWSAGRFTWTTSPDCADWMEASKTAMARLRDGKLTSGFAPWFNTSATFS